VILMTRRWNRLKRHLCEFTSSLFFGKAEKEVVILMYHGISEEPTRDWGPEKYDITTKELESQLKLVLGRFDAISMDQLSEWLQGNRNIPDRAFVVTFDDALQNQFMNALPVLESLNVPATVYVPTATIDNRSPLFERLLAKKISMLEVESPRKLYQNFYQMLRHEPPELRMAVVENLSPADEHSTIHMTQEQLQTLADHYLFSLGGHSHAHRHLTEYSNRELEEDINTSKGILEELIQTDIKHFSYPYGDCNAKVRETIISQGFETAVTTRPRPIEYRECQNRFVIPRIDGVTQFEEWFGETS
jgi:peptidoglycan/xylan/chitin deacetylase (PgdA/CDA1 family)